MSENAQAQWNSDWSEWQQGSLWQRQRTPVQVVGATTCVLLFAVLLFELLTARATTGVAWALAAFLVAAFAVQAVAALLGRQRDAPARAEQVDTPAWQEEAPGEPWQDGADEEPWQDEVLTVACPECGTAFVVSGEAASSGRFHCTHCGVEGFVNDYDLQTEDLVDVTCDSCKASYQAHQEGSRCPECGERQETLLA